MVAAMETGLGNNYLTEIPLEWRSRLRPYPFSLPDALLGIPVAEGQETKGIVFAEPDGIPLKLNVYRSSQPGKQPTLIIIHGGAWRSGDANNDEPFSRYMAAQGYTVITITYRQTPQYRFPVQLEDVRSALAFIQQSADRLDVDQNRVALMGRSAGAHLAMLTAYQPSSLPIRAVVNYYGPVDLTAGYADPPQPDPIDTRAVLRDFLGGTPDQLPDLYRQASPITYATKPVPPTLLMYARRDHLVQAKFGRSLDQQLRSVNSQVVYLEIPWAEHAFDAIFQGVSNQLASYHTDRFLAWALQPK
jgi:acetyl esterase/lipase